MTALCPVAGFAGDHHVLALLLLIDDVGMAGLAGIVTGEGNRPSGCLSDGVAAVVSILSKTMGHHGSAQDDECYERNRYDCGEAN